MACVVLYVVLDSHPVIAVGLALFALPALVDMLRGGRASLQIDDKEIRWQSAGRTDHLPRGQIRTVRLDTRLDFSRRITLLTHQGGKIRLPYECVPPKSELIGALTEHGLPFEQHHFALMG